MRSAESPRDERIGVRPATHFPAEAATGIGSATVDGRRLNGRDRRATSPMCRQVFGLMDTDRQIHLASRLAGRSPGAVDEARFHLPLRGSSGFAPDSLLTQPQQTLGVIEAGTDGTQAIVSDQSRQRIILWLGACKTWRVRGRKRLRGYRYQALRRACSVSFIASLCPLCSSTWASSSSMVASRASTVLGPPPNRRIAVRATWRVSYQA